MNGIKDEIRINFCAWLRNWADTNWAKPKKRKDLAKFLNIKPGQLTNVLSDPPRRCGDEAWRRQVVRKLGLSYEKVIGLEAGALVAEEEPDYLDSKTGGLLDMTRIILESRTRWAEVLKKCIPEFYAASLEQAEREKPDRGNGGVKSTEPTAISYKESGGKLRPKEKQKQ